MTISEIVDNQDAYAGQQVTVRGIITKVHSPHALVIRDEGSFFEFFTEHLVILSAAPLPYTPEQDKGITVQANGNVQEVSVTEIERELGLDLDRELEVKLEGNKAVLVADSVVSH